MTHIGDISGCDEPETLLKVRSFSEPRFGKLKVREKSIAQVDVESAQKNDFPATLT